jgi:hypothetical protein
VLETVNQVPQVSSGLSLVRLGREDEGNVLPRLGRLAVQEEICKKRLNPWRAARGQGCVAHADTEAAQQYGAYQAAMATMSRFQAKSSTLPQPSVTTGLPEVGYSAHYDGVQVQVYSDGPVLTGAAFTALEKAGISLIPMKTA